MKQYTHDYTMWRAEGIDIRIISQIELNEIIDKYLPNL